MKRVLIAGVGNIFLGDDAFGVEVAQRLSASPLPDNVRVSDFGIRSLHLAYEMADSAYDLTLLIDASPRGGRPGTLYVIEPETSLDGPVAVPDGHSINPDAVLASVRALGADPGRVLVVGCEPASVEERMGLSPEVAAAVEEAVILVRELLERECGPLAMQKGARDVSRDPRADRAIAS
jgi:hydrogenase maturation protease